MKRYLYYFGEFFVAALLALLYWLKSDLRTALAVFPAFLIMFNIFISLFRNKLGIQRDSLDKSGSNSTASVQEQQYVHVGGIIGWYYLLSLVLSALGIVSSAQFYIDSVQDTLLDKLDQIYETHNDNHGEIPDNQKPLFCRNAQFWTNKTFELNHERQWNVLRSDKQEFVIGRACDVKDIISTQCKGDNILPNVNLFLEDVSPMCTEYLRRQTSPTP